MAGTKSKYTYIQKLLDNIPAHINPVNFIMDTLNLSQASVYRRLNRKTDFTFDEVVTLAVKLNLSLEEIMKDNARNEILYSLMETGNSMPHELFSTIISNYIDNLTQESEAQERIAFVTTNHLWFMYTFGFPHLLKLFYYKWLHQMVENSSKLDYSDIFLSPDLIILCERVYNLLAQLDRTIFIADEQVFFNTMKEIQYFYRRNLFGKEEFQAIIQDLEAIINYTENHVIKSENPTGASRFFYLSMYNVYSNSAYVECDGKSHSYFYQYSISPYKTCSKCVCMPHLKWIKDLMKHSVLLTSSNESLQVQFFNKQISYLNDLNDNIELIAR